MKNFLQFWLKETLVEVCVEQENHQNSEFKFKIIDKENYNEISNMALNLIISAEINQFSSHTEKKLCIVSCYRQLSKKGKFK